MGLFLSRCPKPGQSTVDVRKTQCSNSILRLLQRLPKESYGANNVLLCVDRDDSREHGS